MSAPPPASPTKLRALNALRFFAAAAVFGNHLFVLARDPATRPAFEVVLVQGASGVAFFFMLSGFILSYGYHERLAGTAREAGALARFYLARVARIYPVHLLTLAVAVALGGAAKLATHLPALAATALLVHSWVPDLAFIGAYNNVAWSLAHEAFFYALFPLLLPFLLGARPLAAGLAVGLPIAALAVAAVLMRDRLYLFYYFPPVRLAEFAAGILLYRAVRARGWFEARGPGTARDTLLEVGCLALVGLTVALATYMPANLMRALAYMPAFLATIAVFARERGALSRLLARPLGFHLGEVSYAFYMSHYLVLGAVASLYAPLGVPATIALAFLATLAASHACFVWYEVPMRTWINGWARPHASRTCPGP